MWVQRKGEYMAFFGNMTTVASKFTMNLGHERFKMPVLGPETSQQIDNISRALIGNPKLSDWIAARRKYTSLEGEFGSSKEWCSTLKEQLEGVLNDLTILQEKLQKEGGLGDKVVEIGEAIKTFQTTIRTDAVFYRKDDALVATIEGEIYHLSSDGFHSLNPSVPQRKLSSWETSDYEKKPNEVPIEPAADSKAAILLQNDQQVTIEQILLEQKWYKNCAGVAEDFKDDQPKADAIRNLLLAVGDSSYNIAQVNIIAQVAEKRLISLKERKETIVLSIKGRPISQSLRDLIANKSSIFTLAGMTDLVTRGTKATFSVFAGFMGEPTTENPPPSDN